MDYRISMRYVIASSSRPQRKLLDASGPITPTFSQHFCTLHGRKLRLSISVRNFLAHRATDRLFRESALPLLPLPYSCAYRYMDARSYLQRQGWQEGNSLGISGNGIKKPLLISFKDNALGIGSKKQKEKQADQWWLRAFDTALKDFGTGKQVCCSETVLLSSR